MLDVACLHGFLKTLFIMRQAPIEFLFYGFIDFNVQYSLDAKKAKEPRMFFLDHEGRNVVNETVRLTKKKQLCTSQQVYLKVSLQELHASYYRIMQQTSICSMKASWAGKLSLCYLRILNLLIFA